MMEKRLRLLNLVAMVSVGTILLLFDIPLPVAMLAAACTWFGIVYAHERARARAKERNASKQNNKVILKKTEGDSKIETSLKNDSFFASLQASAILKSILSRFRVSTKVTPNTRQNNVRIGNFLKNLKKGISSHIFIVREKEKVEQTIDRELNRLIEEKPVKGVSGTPAASAETDKASKEAENKGVPETEDPFTILANAEVDEELIVPETGDVLSGAVRSTSTLGEAEGAVQSGNSESKEKSGVLSVQPEETGEGLAFEGLNELDLGDIDLESLVPEVEAENEAGAMSAQNVPTVAPASTIEGDKNKKNAISPGAPSPVSTIKTPAAESPKEPAAFQQDFLTASNSDVLSLLKNDVSKVRIEKDLSLLRDLKDQKFDAGDLIREMNEILECLPSKNAVKKAKGKAGG